MTTGFERRCTRCGKELTDAASRNAGIGPVCRDMDNAVLARTLKSDPEKAKALLSGIVTAKWPEEPAEALGTAIILLETGPTSDSDCRWLITKLEFVLSFGESRAWLDTFCEAAEAMGYAALPALWRGEIAKSMTTLWLSKTMDRLFIASPNKRAGRTEIKQIRGRRFHPKGEIPDFDRACWSVPLIEHEALKNVVMRNYPIHEFLNGLTWEQLTKLSPMPPPAVGVVILPHPEDRPGASAKKHRVVMFCGAANVYFQTPYDSMFVRRMRELAAHWAPITRLWAVSKSFEREAERYARECFPDAEFSVVKGLAAHD